jgi:hypothetical protein
MARPVLADDRALEHVERGEETGRAMPLVAVHRLAGPAGHAAARGCWRAILQWRPCCLPAATGRHRARPQPRPRRRRPDRRAARPGVGDAAPDRSPVGAGAASPVGRRSIRSPQETAPGGAGRRRRAVDTLRRSAIKGQQPFHSIAGGDTARRLRRHPHRPGRRIDGRPQACTCATAGSCDAASGHPRHAAANARPTASREPDPGRPDGLPLVVPIGHAPRRRRAAPAAEEAKRPRPLSNRQATAGTI